MTKNIECYVNQEDIDKTTKLTGKVFGNILDLDPEKMENDFKDSLKNKSDCEIKEKIDSTKIAIDKTINAFTSQKSAIQTEESVEDLYQKSFKKLEEANESFKQPINVENNVINKNFEYRF